MVDRLLAFESSVEFAMPWPTSLPGLRPQPNRTRSFLWKQVRVVGSAQDVVFPLAVFFTAIAKGHLKALQHFHGKSDAARRGGVNVEKYFDTIFNEISILKSGAGQDFDVAADDRYRRCSCP